MAFTLTLGGCSGGVVLEPTDGLVLEARKVAKAATPITSVTGIELGNPAETALHASQVFFESAQIVVLASSVEPAAHARAGSIAVTLGAPLLLTAPPGENIAGQNLASQDATTTGSGGLNTELLRLGTRGVITVGEVSLHQLDTTSLVVQPAPDNLEELARMLPTELTEVPAPAPADEMRDLQSLEPGQIYTAGTLGLGPTKYGRLPATLPAERNPDVIAFSTASTRHYAGVATARAAGARVFVGSDLGSYREVVDYVSKNEDLPIVGFGEDLQDPQRLQRLANMLHSGSTLPTGAQRVYQLDDAPVRLVTVSAERAFLIEGTEHAGDVLEYALEQASAVQKDASGRVMPGVEVAAEETSDADLDYWVAQSREHDQYLVLTVRPRGGTLTAVEALGDLVNHAHVGVRIDLSRRGEISPAEVHEVATYLRRVVRDHHLPQKLLIIDIGQSTQVGTSTSSLSATPEVALTFAVTNGESEQWESAREAVGAKVAWSISVLPKEPDDEDEDPTRVQYPGFNEIAGRGDVSLIAFR